MKTLKSIFFLCLVSCILCLKVNAQIVYTDVNPDDTISLNGGLPWTATYDLDIDNNALTDFTLSDSYFHLGGCGSGAPPKRRATALILSSDTNFFFGSINTNPAALNFGDTINNNYNWQSASDTLFYAAGGICTSFDTSGNWRSVSDHYLPFKFVNLGTNYYGWVRINLYQVITLAVGPIRIIIKGYAFNSIPNQYILAGSGLFPANLSVIGSSTICSGDSTTIIASGGTSYLWDTGDTTASISVSPVGNTTYSVTVSDTSTGSSILLSQTITVTPHFIPSIYQLGSTLYANILSALSYQWIDCSTMLPVPVNGNWYLYQPQTSGSYAVIINNNVCIDTSACYTYSMVGINEIENSRQFLICPNPATSSVTIKFPSDEAGEIQIVNLFGQVVYSENLRGFQNLGGLETGEIKIDVSKFPSGMYVVRWNNGENFETKTFSVIK